MAGADVQIGNQTIPGAFGLTDKMIATIKRWTAEAKILGKEVKLLPPGSKLDGLPREDLKNTIVLTPEMKFILRLIYPPGDPEPYWIWCDFPASSDFFYLQFRRGVGKQHEEKVKGDVTVRRHFIRKILKHAALAGLDPHFLMAGERPLYWEFRDVIYYDGLTKDEFFRRYRALGATGQYLHASFNHLFLKDGGGKNGAGNGSNSHLYL